MEVNDLRNKKRALEKEIGRLIQEFETETNCAVNDLKLTKSYAIVFGRTEIFNKVDAEVKL